MRVLVLAAVAALSVSPALAQSMIAPPPTPGIDVPDWALPQSPTHRQVPPPLDYHRPAVTTTGTIGQFEAQSDIGGPLMPGSASYDPASKTYTISSAGYNIWYQRDEFRYLWKKMSGDVSLAADVIWADINEFHDRKVALVIRDSLDDDSRTIVAAQHGNGMVHIAWRDEKSGKMTDISHRAARQPKPDTTEKGPQALHASRIGIEKKGDSFQMWISWQGEPMHPEGAPITLHLDGPFYVGVGLASHLPATTTQVRLDGLVLENRAGAVR